MVGWHVLRYDGEEASPCPAPGTRGVTLLAGLPLCADRLFSPPAS